MKTRELFGKYHQSIDELSRSAAPDSNWQEALKRILAAFETEAGHLDAASVDSLRESLCTQFEHEALVATHASQRQILSAAVKWLEETGERGNGGRPAGD